MSAEEKSGRLGIKGASMYLKSIGENTRLSQVLSKNLGRTLNASVFKNWLENDDFSGLMVWFCKKRSNGRPFLVFEMKDKTFDYKKLSIQQLKELRPNSKILFYSNNRFYKTLSNPELNFRNYLAKHRTYSEPINFGVDSETVTKWVDNFLKDDLLTDYVGLPFGYLIRTENDIDYFYEIFYRQNEDVKYLRYYFGFDSDEKVNLIRFFLVPVGQDGKNIVSNAIGKEEGNFLQYSWPPPPDSIL